MGMKKSSRNDPCPCGSGKKYKQCCWKAEEARSDRSEAVPKAIEWLIARYGQAAVREALDDGFFGGLNDDEYATLWDQHRDAFEGIMANAMGWLVADGIIIVKGQERRIAELLLGQGGPLLSAEQRHWIERLVATPLGLYEVIEVVPGVSLRLKDVVFTEKVPVLVRERAGSQQVVKFDLIAARILPLADHFELSGAVYPLPRQRSLDLITELKQELEGLAPDSPQAKEILGVIIPDYWLKLFVKPIEIPQIVDQLTGELILLITDHYRVQDWAALDQALSGEADVEGSREQGWSRLFEGKDGLRRTSVAINPGKPRDSLAVFYRTQHYADRGRPWFEGVAGGAVAFVSREITDPRGMLANRRPAEIPEPSPPAQLPPEVIAEVIGKRIRQLYADWADQPLPVLDDKTPREAIQIPEGLEQVKFLLHTYEHGEIQQAKNQQRPPVSYDFLWHELGITP